MSDDVTGPRGSGTGSSKARDSLRGHARIQQRPGDARRDAVPDVVVEEIFLEGDSMTMLRHEAGSSRTLGLLESAVVPGPEPGRLK